MTRLICLGVAVIPGMSACVLPYSGIENASPKIVGEYWTDDGPASSKPPIFLAPNGSACTTFNAQTTVDSGGRFIFSRTTVQRRWALIFPPIERFTNPYTLCQHREGSTEPHEIYSGYVVLTGNVVDSITCIEWRWAERTQVACGTPREGNIVIGGRWTAETTTGSTEQIPPRKTYGLYRVIYRLDVQKRLGFWRNLWRDKDFFPRIFVQWVELTDAGTPGKVRTTREIILEPTGSPTPSVLQLVNEQGVWRLKVHTTHSRILRDRERVVMYKLGSPDELEMEVDVDTLRTSRQIQQANTHRSPLPSKTAPKQSHLFSSNIL